MKLGDVRIIVKRINNLPTIHFFERCNNCGGEGKTRYHDLSYPPNDCFQCNGIGVVLIVRIPK